MSETHQIREEQPEAETSAPDTDQGNDYRRIHIGVVFALPFALLFFISLPAGFITGLLEISFIWAVVPIQLLAIYIPTIWFLKRYRISMGPLVSPRWPKFPPLFNLLIFFFGFFILSDTLSYYLIVLLPDFLSAFLQSQIEVMELLLLTDNPVEIILYILFAVIGAGFFEELLFRGLLLKACLVRMPVTPSILLNGIFFATMHQSALLFTYYLFIGIVLSYIAVRTGTLIYGIMIHSLLNLSVFLVSRHFGAAVYRLPIPVWLAIVGGFGAMVLGLWFFGIATGGKTQHAPSTT